MTKGVSVGPHTLLSEREAATVLGCSVFCLRAWRRKRVGVPHFRIGRLCRYQMSDLQTFLMEHRVEPVVKSTTSATQ
jgi:Helix-turn-helix domain